MDRVTVEFDAALHQLSLLSEIQEHVGRDLKKGSQTLLASSSVLSHLQMALLVVIGLLMQILALPTEPLDPTKSGHRQPS